LGVANLPVVRLQGGPGGKRFQRRHNGSSNDGGEGERRRSRKSPPAMRRTSPGAPCTCCS
jgi:hypothetical protein